MRSSVTLVLTGFCAFTLVACGENEAEVEAQRAQARADSVMIAEQAYDAGVFDTVTWESEEARLERGALVYRSSCQKCHGANGGGNGDVAMQFELEVPSFQAPEWEYAGDVPALRHRVFVGHEGAMPNWGLHGLRYRDVDAVAAHIATTITAAETSESES
jgi:mono/diheme cytochrome c family protein